MDNRWLINPDEIANEHINFGHSISDQIQSQRLSHKYLGDKVNYVVSTRSIASITTKR